ncbi:MAG: carbon monoxide dehydrogenase subunit G [Chloroflexi bacterium]|nr:carbon monoxide dehydrogenase subunit G [Chloroflexota bacterium]
MHFKDTVTINAPLEKTWAFIIDANQVAQCAPGLESVEVIEENQKYKVTASIGFGNIKVRFLTDLEFVEMVEPSFAKIKAHGTAPGSAADVLAEMSLTEIDENTTSLAWNADITILGTIASLANRMMGSVTKKLAGQFFGSVKEKVETG